MLAMAEDLELDRGTTSVAPGSERRCALTRALKPTAEMIREFCTGRLAHFKIPRYVHVTEEFPMTVTGKIRKVEMRERSVEILRLG